MADVPTDVLVDVTTQVGEGEGTGEGEGEETTTKPNLPSKTDISLPKLIITKFPFSIPFDLYAMLSLLAADPVEPVFRIPIEIRNPIKNNLLVDYDIVIDFSGYSTWIELIRWGEYILFVVGLAMITRNVIKW